MEKKHRLMSKSRENQPLISGLEQTDLMDEDDVVIPGV